MLDYDLVVLEGLYKKMRCDYLKSKSTITRMDIFLLIIGAFPIFVFIDFYVALFALIPPLSITLFLWAIDKKMAEDAISFKFELLHEFADLFIKYRPVKKENKDLLQNVINDYGFRRPKIFLRAFERFITDEKRDSSYI